ncbi:MAG TPA: ABC transporter ATP-binding protein [Chloroflexus aurantiacus]|jgi:ABC-2 type transport system ATP-binding protein|uniref:ABC transporter related n=1 Tax=Chloroflexus aurantiacus (strain ATCC 29366 / DSM 635 / J-10-fl) TaxID=324602 RepID=A9WJ53_CHLAA|nr:MULTISPECIES: ABC transporter ATP-binding protein [Chloroflexus]RMG48125.1 MAG: ABC transporter ATP-binding protein [Chloroflexota bacterium]ABY34330.1 ABC transporter related [Chloroflexus aurantiacus J-10-fl]GIV93376.1 MAG: ABC transporter [Chloroflexus sp.]GIV95279.1 MAG: ABC transporter [Chloroflexus sp.]HBW68571.1 ABC transporter ATP-binding protein [Chloroflexus aurantiacus]
MTDVIVVEGLTKSYGHVSVLRGVHLRVAAGEVYGLLGPNGAGKSTLIHLLLGFLYPDSGRIRVLGSADLEAQRRQIGYIPERQRYHNYYTPREYLTFLGRFDGMPETILRKRIDELLELTGLTAVANRYLRTLSKGMIQRLGIAQALLTDPDLLLIDEPTSGLDLDGQQELLVLLNDVRQRGHTVLLCTHRLAEVEYLCDRVGILTNGKVALEVNVADVRHMTGSMVVQTGPLDLPLRQRLEMIGREIRCDEQAVVISPHSPELQAKVLQVLIEANVTIRALEPQLSRLAQIYMRTVRGEPVDNLLVTDQAPLRAVLNEAINPAPTDDIDPLLKRLLQRREGDSRQKDGHQ